MKLIDYNRVEISNHTLEYNDKFYYRTNRNERTSITTKWYAPSKLPIGKDTPLFAELEAEFQKLAEESIA